MKQKYNVFGQWDQAARGINVCLFKSQQQPLTKSNHHMDTAWWTTSPLLFISATASHNNCAQCIQQIFFFFHSQMWKTHKHYFLAVGHYFKVVSIPSFSCFPLTLQILVSVSREKSLRGNERNGSQFCFVGFPAAVWPIRGCRQTVHTHSVSHCLNSYYVHNGLFLFGC